eukprot:Skav205947  [mRNA]  locus=scaffold442:51986:53458:+ [translate_table: standard]
MIVAVCKYLNPWNIRWSTEKLQLPDLTLSAPLVQSVLHQMCRFRRCCARQSWHQQCCRRCRLPERSDIFNRLSERLFCLRCVFGSLAVLLLAVVVLMRIQTGSLTHKPYLDSIGIGATIWGVFFIYKFLATFGPPEPPSQFPPEVLEAQVRQVFETSDDVPSCLRRFCSPFKLRLLTFLVILCRFLFNVYSITSRVWYLEREQLPKESDLEKEANPYIHVIAWIEFPIMAGGLVLMTSHFVVAVCPSISSFVATAFPDLDVHHPSAKSLMFVNMALPTLGGFSTLRALKIARSKKKEIKQIWKKTGSGEPRPACQCTADCLTKVFMTVLKVIECLILIIVGSLALLVKSFQVLAPIFVTGTIFAWTWRQTLTFLAFANNVSATVDNWEGDCSRSLKLEMIQLQIKPRNPDAFLTNLMTILGRRLREVYGFLPGFIILCTVSKEDFDRLIEQLGYQRPQGGPRNMEMERLAENPPPFRSQELRQRLLPELD